MMMTPNVFHTSPKCLLRLSLFQFIINKGFLKKAVFASVIVFAVFFGPAVTAFGQGDSGFAPGGTSASDILGPSSASEPSAQPLENPLNAESFQILLQKIVALAAKIGIPLAAIMIIWGGFQFVTAQGNEEKLKTAKATLTLAVIGTVVLIGAWVISIAVVDIAKSL